MSMHGRIIGSFMVPTAHVCVCLYVCIMNEHSFESVRKSVVS